ncbi:MAG: ArgE/DapE family deacylase [Lachnospiraceae bacterium]|nr:ArgE/DapE family deacylase [Lachnospiraceae bacterium]
MIDKLKKALEENRETYIKHLKELVSIDTHVLAQGLEGGLEKKGQEYIASLLRSMGADEVKEDPMEETLIEEAGEKYGEGNPGHNQTGRSNVYGTFRGKAGGKSLLFNGHVDVMPVDGDEGWKSDPFDPVIEDGKMFGRGTADMKSGLMASIMAVKLVQDAGLDLPGDVTITSVCDEEGGGNGSIQAVMRGLKADGVVNCEPTNDEAIAAHMGWVFFKVEFEGKACHSGEKGKGVSAIAKAIKVIEALNEREHEWLLSYRHPLCPPPNLNIGVIEGGTAGSTVPGYCSFSTCVHFVPSLMTQEQIIEEFNDVVKRTADADPWLCAHPPKVTIFQRGRSFEMETDHPFVDAFREAYRLSTDKELKIVGSPMGCDSRLWRNIAGCPTIQFGPGRPQECHSVNEWVEIESYLNAILIYAELILQMGK